MNSHASNSCQVIRSLGTRLIRCHGSTIQRFLIYAF
jgi:hypothetical protein